MFQHYYYSASATLGIWDSLADLPKSFKKELNASLKLYSGGVVELKDINQGITNDQTLLSFIAVLEKIITRGNPTISFLNFESRLLQKSIEDPSDLIDLKDRSESRALGYSTSIPIDFESLKLSHFNFTSQHSNDNLKAIQTLSQDE